LIIEEKNSGALNTTSHCFTRIAENGNFCAESGVGKPQQVSREEKKEIRDALLIHCSRQKRHNRSAPLRLTALYYVMTRSPLILAIHVWELNIGLLSEILMITYMYSLLFKGDVSPAFNCILFSRCFFILTHLKWNLKNNILLFVLYVLALMDVSFNKYYLNLKKNNNFYK